jgi:hypothetical protein
VSKINGLLSGDNTKAKRLQTLEDQMVIYELQKVSSENVQNFAWSGLRQYHNIGITAEQHARLHNVSSTSQNVKKQAAQIRDSLMQAKEYYDASKAVTLATKPVLMYYSALSLAVAEMLMKNDGNVSLDRARVEHNHHGLNFRTDLTKGNMPDLNHSAQRLRAIPSIRKDANGHLRRFGTFELWHRGAREYPVSGYTEYVNQIDQVKQTTLNTLFLPSDDRLVQINSSGISLLDCFKHIPSLISVLSRHGIESSLVRTHCAGNSDGINTVITITIQPTRKTHLDTFIKNIKIYPRMVPHYEFREFNSGGVITYRDTTNYTIYINMRQQCYHQEWRLIVVIICSMKIGLR